MSDETKVDRQREHRRRFRAERGYSTAAHYATGGNREDVLARDGWACVGCGMTDAQHLEKWGGRPITVDHIDRDRTNNALDNLQILCLSCHGRKDQTPALRERKTDTTALRALRAEGYTYEEIARHVGVSIATAWKWAKGAR